MERLNRVILLFCLLNTGIYLYLHTQQRLEPLTPPGDQDQDQEGGVSGRAINEPLRSFTVPREGHYSL